MINPLFNPLFPSLPVTVWALDQPNEGMALLDTGFEGDVIIPAHLGTGSSGPGQDLILADESVIEAPIRGGFVQIGDLESVPAEVIYMGNEFIIGMGILHRHEVILDHGQRVIVNPGRRGRSGPFHSPTLLAFDIPRRRWYVDSRPGSGRAMSASADAAINATGYDRER